MAEASFLQALVSVREPQELLAALLAHHPALSGAALWWFQGQEAVRLGSLGNVSDLPEGPLQDLPTGLEGRVGVQVAPPVPLGAETLAALGLAASALGAQLERCAAQARAAALQALMDLYGAALDLTEAAERIVAAVAPVARVDYAGLAFAQDETIRFQAVYVGPRVQPHHLLLFGENVPRAGTLTDRALRRGAALFMDQAHLHMAEHPLRTALRPEDRITSAYLPLPATPQGTPVLVLARFDGRPWLQEERQLLHTAGAAAQHHVAQTQHLAAWQAVALHDPLTGLGNRRAFELALDELEDRGQNYSLAMLDVNGFKGINDRWGHVAGDRLLRAFGVALARELDGLGKVYRWGGDEFCLLLNPLESSESRALQLRIAAAGQAVDLPGGPVQASVGIARRREVTTSNACLRLADQRMYEAKFRRKPPRPDVTQL